MSEIVCPYDEITLRLALLSLEEKMGDESLGKRVNSRLSEFLIDDKADLNKKIAEHNGISVMDLINSPNYGELTAEFSKILMLKSIAILKEERFSDKEAWALVAIGTGTLKI